MRKLLLVLPAIVIVTVGLIVLAPFSREEQSIVARADIHHNPTSRAIRARLAAELGRDASGIVIGVEENVAVLSGEVMSRRVLRRAVEIAESMPGIVVVHNFLELVPGAPDDDTTVEPARLAAIEPSAVHFDETTPVGVEK